MRDRVVLYVFTFIGIVLLIGTIDFEVSFWLSEDKAACEAIDGVFLKREGVCIGRGAIIDVRAAK